MSQAWWPQLGWNWSSCRGGGPEWLQGALPDLFGEVAPAAGSIVSCGLAIEDLSFITGLCSPKKDSRKGSILATG